MAYTTLLTSDNKFSPQFAPAVLSRIEPYIVASTGLPSGAIYSFYGTNLTTVTADNYIDRFLLMEKGNQELYALFLTLSNGESVHFYTPNGYYLRFYRYVYYIAGHAYYTINIYANDGNGEFVIGSPGMDVPYKRWLSFQIDEENEKAVCMLWTLQSEDPASGNANFQNASGLSDAQKTSLYNILKDILPIPDPYKNGGTSTNAGGGGDQTFSSDAIGEPSAPTLSPQGSRLLTIYKVDSTILKDFANYLWAGGIDFATLHNIFNDTMGAVISLAVCPFTPSGNTPQNLWFGNFDSGVSATLVDLQYETVDCGTLSLDEEYKSALDYNPYCKIELCLPYCGNVALDPDEFMGNDISIKYKIDLLTGACIACVFADGNLLLTVPGNVLASVPVTNSDHKAIVSSVAGTAISVAGAALAVATGGMSAPAAATTAATASAANTLNMKERYSHGGTGNANTALLGPQKPYLIIKWPRQCLPIGNAKYQGYPSMITESLGDLSGFTQVHKIHLDGISATQTEMMELEAALREGVIL